MFHKEDAVSNQSSSKMKFVFIKICILTFVTMKSINWQIIFIIFNTSNTFFWLRYVSITTKKTNQIKTNKNLSFFKCYRCRNIHIWLHLEFRNLDYFSKNIDINSWCFKNIILNKKCQFQQFLVYFWRFSLVECNAVFWHYLAFKSFIYKN